MKKKNLPDTSLDANRRATLEMRADHWNKILSALERLELATYEQIAVFAGLDRHQVGRRLCELRGQSKVLKLDTKWPTSSGRSAYQYALPGYIAKEGTAVEKSMPGKTISDFSRNILKQTTLF